MIPGCRILNSAISASTTVLVPTPLYVNNEKQKLFTFSNLRRQCKSRKVFFIVEITLATSSFPEFISDSSNL